MLLFLAMQSVILFSSGDKMLAVVHKVTKATAWHEESIRLHTSPPITTHLRAYIAMADGQPSGTQSLTPDREEVPQSPPSNPTQMEGLHASSTWTLGMSGMPN